MSVDFNTQISNAAASYSAAPTATPSADNKAADETAADAVASNSKAADFGEAAVYEKSAEPEASVTAKPTQKEDRTALINQLKADEEQRRNQLLDIVRKTMQGQGKAIAQTDDMWKFLAGGDFTVDPATKAQAEADVADDGYWGAEQTSDRILDFAKSLAGDDPEKADQMLDAFKKGFEEATKTWGKDLPELSQRTYDAVLQKFDDWKNSKSSADTAQQTQQAQQAQQQAAAASATAQ